MSALNATFTAANNKTGATTTQSLSAGQFAASFITAIIVFSVQVGVFLLIKDRLARIYQPRTFLVPERERTKPAPPGWFNWIKPVLQTSNSEFVQKCGLDAYFFLRYLRTLLKIFVPAACVMIPILLPINAASGTGGVDSHGSKTNNTNTTGLDRLAWGNVSSAHTHRYWAHWILALLLIVLICYVVFDELKTYIRMRQAYMTSPQHRLKASATTVLVSSIPEKWCSVEALDNLFDVFPGGLRNIWINRNFDDLSKKVKQRDKLAAALEAAETELIRKCFKENEEQIKKAAKEVGKKFSKAEKQRHKDLNEEKGRSLARGKGLNLGNPHQVTHTISEAINHNRGSISSSSSSSSSSSESENEDVAEAETTEGQQEQHRAVPVPVQAAKEGLTKVKGGIFGGFRTVNKGIKGAIDTSNGFIGSGPAQHTSEKRKASLAKAKRRSDAGQDLGMKEKYFDAVTIPSSNLPQPGPGSEKGHSVAAAASECHETEGSGYHGASVSEGSRADIVEKQKLAERQEPGLLGKVMQAIGLSSEPKEEIVYAAAFDPAFEHDPLDATWRKYLEEKERETMRLPIFGWDWMPSLPLIGEKVDTIRYCREHVARLNAEIEEDQQHPERYPLLNSAFVQFNHQVAAHMCCQSVSHHLPKQMAPRMVEIDPNDVVWDNMSIPWWQSYFRTTGVVSIVICMVAVWAVPVAFTSALAQLSTAAQTYHWLAWVMEIPSWIRSLLQGVLPQALLGLLLWLLPVILRFLSKMQGLQSGTLIELSVQKYYLFFLFVQIFLIVTVATSALDFVSTFTSVNGIANIPSLLGKSIPKSSNYFISYMLLQALSVSAGALLQVGALVGWFLLGPLFDSTARSKFRRQITLPDIQWGTFFPVYTNLACIGIIYSVISPLILLFNVVSFSLFWFVYRYNTLYVTGFSRDTGGLLYPNAINTTYVGVYVMELTLIGMFFLVRDEDGNVACAGQAIGMIVIMILTIVYQVLLNSAFSPLFKYLPITLEDDAVKRDEEFMRVMKYKHDGIDDDKDLGESSKEQIAEADDDQLEEYELRAFDSEKPKKPEFQNPEVMNSIDEESKSKKFMKNAVKKTADNALARAATIKLPGISTGGMSWADKNQGTNHRAAHFGGIDGQQQQQQQQQQSSEEQEGEKEHHHKHIKADPRKILQRLNSFNPVTGGEKDVEAQTQARNDLAQALFSGVDADLEDLMPEERDELVQRAFQHPALRARRPVVWLPCDELGVSDDEVKRMGTFSNKLWVSNVRQGLDSKGRCIYGGAPPDFSEVDLIRL